MRHSDGFPPRGVLAEVATVTFRRRTLLVPDPLLRAIVVGFLARAGRTAGVPVCAFSLAHDHYHLLLRVPGRGALGRFMAYFNAGLSREIHRRTGCGSPVWSRGYRARRVADEPEIQEARLAALLARGCAGRSAFSRRRPPDTVWAAAPRDPSPLAGIWFDRSGEGAARRRGEYPTLFAFAVPEPLRLAPLPAWDTLPAEERQARLEAIVGAIARPEVSAAGPRPLRLRTRLHLVNERCWVFGRRDRRESWLA